MRKALPVLGILVILGSAFGENHGNGTVETENGSLRRVDASWSSGSLALARWWWRQDAPGSAWTRVGPVQAGALEAGWGGEGLRSWRPASSSAGGRWGVAVLTPGAGAWTVQTPDALEAGCQGRWDWGLSSWRFGAARVWSLISRDPSWDDAFRGGLVLGASRVRLSDDVLVSKGNSGGWEASQKLRLACRWRQAQFWGAWRQPDAGVATGEPSVGAAARWRRWSVSVEVDPSDRSMIRVGWLEFGGIRELSVQGELARTKTSDVRILRLDWDTVVAGGRFGASARGQWGPSRTVELLALWSTGPWTARACWLTSLESLEWFGRTSTIELAISQDW